MSSNSFDNFIKSLSLDTIFEMFSKGVFKAEKLHSQVLNTVNEKIIFSNNIEVNSALYDELCRAALMESKSCDASYRNNSEEFNMPSTSSDIKKPSTSYTGYGISSMDSTFNRTEQKQTLKKNKTRTNKYISVISETSKFYKKFNTTGRVVQFKIRDEEVGNNPHEWLEHVFEELLAKSLEDCGPNDYLGIRIDNANLPERPIGISLRKANQYNTKVVMDVLTSVLQSNERFFTSDLLTMAISRVTLPSGCGGYVKLTGEPAEVYCSIKHRSFIFTPLADDNMCLARALVLAIVFKTENNSVMESLLKNMALLDERALRLCVNVGINRHTICNYEHIQLFQNFLQSYTIIVYNSRKGLTTYYEGPRCSDRVVLNLYLENNHYCVIKSLTGAFSTQYFCELCRKGYSRIDEHRNCPYKCPCCTFTPQCRVIADLIQCDLCNRDFRGVVCLENHKKSICSHLRRCLNCFKSVWKSKKGHKCGFEYCSTCGSEKPIRHHCFMRVIKDLRSKTKNYVFIFYDLECTQDTLDDRGYFEHIPNLCVSQKVCELCLNDDDILRDCRLCGKRQHIFKDNPVKEFLEYISKSSRKCNVIVIAHNMKGYDGTFVLREIMKNIEAWDPKIISNGTKLMSIKCGNIKFLDSLNFMPLPLSKLPATFGFADVKGFFPYLFNTYSNRNYTGPIPNSKFYAPDDMNIEERTKFFNWYNEMTNSGFVFKMCTEIEKYCISDVNILRKSCLKFRETFITSTGLDPFLKSTTIASACNLLFRGNFLKENTIGLINPKGYRMADKQSASALKWLLHMQNEWNTPISHSGVGSEFRLPEGILVDGYENSTRTVFEYNGCYFHGCRKCYKNHTIAPECMGDNNNNKIKIRQKEQLFQRYEHTIAKQRKIRSLGYNLVTTWECEFNEFLKRNENIKTFLERQFEQYENPLNPRDAFFGGRTNAVKLNYRVNPNENEEIHYYDVCSLYPFVNKYKKYPIGHPTIHIGNDCINIDLNTVEGLVKCSVLPPQNLYHPVLPYRCNGKLMFPLCRTCVENYQQTECQHADVERSFIGTYVADELRKAVEMNYKVLKIIEVWEYEVTQYNTETKEGGLFSEYVNTFLKMKQENSGWPSNCINEQEKENYIEEYFQREGIKLDIDKISKNSGFRYLAKLMLNSFWGKFGQRENLPQTSIIYNPEELFKIITDPSINTKSIMFIDDKCIVMNWESVNEAINPLKTVNVAIAAYTTASARLVLYEYLEKLDRRIIYFDTDSIFVTKKRDEWLPETGDFLGMMTNELETYGKNSYITEFISSGPKSYSFKVFSPEKNQTETVCKVKGITLNYKNSQLINFDSMRSLVLGELDLINTLSDRKILRRSNYQVISKSESKVYTVQFNKRRRIPDSFDSVPYGFKLL